MKEKYESVWQFSFKTESGGWSGWHDGKIGDWIFDKGREYKERAEKELRQGTLKYLTKLPTP